jgi:hypothetical protein
MKNKIFSLLLFLFYVSCNPQNDFNRGYIIDKDTELGDIITLVREDTTFYRYVGKNNEKQILQRGVVVKYHSSNGVVDTAKLWDGSRVINSHVNKICSDDSFILVDQKPLDSIFGKYETRLKDDESMYGRPFMPHNLLEAEKKLRKSNIHCYWIINKHTDDIYGPLSKEEFFIKRSHLNVPNELEFN